MHLEKHRFKVTEALKDVKERCQVSTLNPKTIMLSKFYYCIRI